MTTTPGSIPSASPSEPSRRSELPPVVHEDAAIIAFNKPSGLLVAPDRWDKSLPDLMRMIHARLSPGIFNAHRIDKDTSGLVLCAKTKPALDALSRAFQERRVEKVYLAIVRSAPDAPEGTISRGILVDPRRPGLMYGNSRGKKSETRYQVLEHWRRYSLIQAEPLTGRTHQVRIHLAYIRCPIVGDEAYGDGKGLLLSELKRNYKEPREGERPLIARLALHAWRLTFPHPDTGAAFTLEAPLPKDFEIALKYLRKYGA